MKASPADQIRLLEVQADDARLDALANRRRTLPALAEISRLTREITDLDSRIGSAQTDVSDLTRSQTKASNETGVVRARLDRNNVRLSAGTGSAKDLQATSSENVSLHRRIAVLEEAELEVMEQVEVAESTLAELRTTRDGSAVALADAEQQRDAAFADLDDDLGRVRPHREQAAAQLPEQLATRYERIRASAGGVGAAQLADGRCTGCRLQLNVSELATIRNADPDEVLECDECGRILVRA